MAHRCLSRNTRRSPTIAQSDRAPLSGDGASRGEAGLQGRISEDRVLQGSPRLALPGRPLGSRRAWPGCHDATERPLRPGRAPRACRGGPCAQKTTFAVFTLILPSLILLSFCKACSVSAQWACFLYQSSRLYVQTTNFHGFTPVL